jgi:hypothetical protein
MWGDFIAWAKAAKWISASTAHTLTGYVLWSVVLIFGSKSYDKINRAVEKVYIIDYRLQSIENTQGDQNRYIYGLSECQEFSTNHIIKIQRETIKQPINLPLIEHMQQAVIEDQKKKLPHYYMRPDSTWQPVIGVRKKATK